MCMMMADTMDALGLQGQYVVKVNNRKVLDGVMEAIGLGGDENAGRRLTVLRSIDKLDKLGTIEVHRLLTVGRWDGGAQGFGDFTPGAGLLDQQANRILDFVRSGIRVQGETLPAPPTGEEKHFLKWPKSASDKDPNEYWYRVKNIETVIGMANAIGGSTDTTAQGLSELSAIVSSCISADYGQAQIIVDPSVVRGLEYYTGPVYEIELTFPVTNEEGETVRFGSVGGGGRYDGLVSRFLNEPVPATGFSIGVSRLLAALFAIKSPIVMGAVPLGPVVVTVMDKDRIADYQRMVATLRKAGIRAELYLGDAGFKAQMKYADRRNAPCVIIQGSDEAAKGEVQIKDLAVGAELATIAKDDREGYLAKQAEAQFAVKVEDLVAGVRKVLDRRRSD
jgi:histidyl-tRNA synthetase